MLRWRAYGEYYAILQDNCLPVVPVCPELVQGPFFLHQGGNPMLVAPAKAGAVVGIGQGWPFERQRPPPSRGATHGIKGGDLWPKRSSSSTRARPRPARCCSPPTARRSAAPSA